MLDVGGDGLNSHAPLIWKYRPMLNEWKKLGKKHAPLSAENIARILDASPAAEIQAELAGK